MKPRSLYLPLLLLTLNPAALQADVAQCEELVRAGEYAKALDTLPADDQTPEACYWRGRALVPLERHGEAAINFEKVPQEHPLYPYAAKGVIYCAWQSHYINFVEAVAPLTISGNQEIASLATAAIAEFQLRHTRGGDASALQELKRMADEDPKFLPMVKLLEIDDLRVQGKYEEAISAAKAIDENRELPLPMRHRARLAMAEVYYSQKETELGEETLLQFIAANPDSPLLDEAFRMLVLHRAFITSSYTLDRLEDWSIENNKPHRAAMALLMLQRAALGGNAKDTSLTALATTAATRTGDPAARTVILEQVRLLLAQGKQQEAARFLSFIKDTHNDPRVRFYNAACQPDGSEEALHAYMECLDDAPAELQPVAAANALYCAYRCGDNATLELLLGKNLPRHARRAMLLMYAALTQETNPAVALQSLDAVEKLSPSATQAAEADLIRASIRVLDDPAGTFEQLQELEKSPKLAEWTTEQKLRLYQLLMEAVDNAQGYGAKASDEAAIELARRILKNATIPAIATEFTFNLAGRLSDIGEHEEAFALLENLSGSATTPETKARALLLAAEEAAHIGSMEMLEKAISLFEQCARIPSPYRDRADAHRADVLMWTNHIQDALLILRGLLDRESELTPEDRFLAYTVLADTYSMQGTSASRELALKASGKLLEMPDLSPAWRSRALLQHASLHSRYGLHEKALEDYLTILKTNPETCGQLTKSEWYRLNYASAGAVYEYIQLGDKQGAAALAEKVAEWLQACPSRMVDELDLAPKRENFAHWAKAIRRSL